MRDLTVVAFDLPARVVPSGSMQPTPARLGPADTGDRHVLAATV